MPCILIQFAAARSFDYAQDDGAGRAYARAFEEKNFAREYRPNSQRKRSLRLVGKRKISSVKGERLRIANPTKAQKFFVQWRISAALTSIVLASTLTSIGDNAFNNCPNLTSVTFADPNGWWYASNETATSGTSITEDLSDPAVAATCLKSTYADQYWKKS